MKKKNDILASVICIFNKNVLTINIFGVLLFKEH